MTNAVTAGRLAGAPAAPPTPQQARSTWPRMAALGAALLVLGVLALTWSGVGPRLLLAALGVFAVVRGIALLRSARAGEVERTGAVLGAAAVWIGVVLAALALVSATTAGWALVAAVVLLPVLAAAAAARRAALTAAAVVVAGAAVALGLLGRTDALLSTGRVVVGVVVAVLGLANLAGAVGMARIARRPAPAPAAAGCGGCACGAGGCGALG
ncbi:membrane protein of unknown function [Modestobacter italicus]|uniref:Uncharacterized protein n=1 Tax=Modestobacter italicus (strain DSM 44449 / CECT 9708 / BC 501) TaxID=2732864 RepID=I4F1X9_MODI5|nr:hypothetical protein [Modestobacter marinus]CCH89642.1 membrane protein of unknown function [Modestobacter marinus]